MRLSVSTQTLPPFDHLRFLPDLAALGVDGLEIAPDVTWTDRLDAIPASAIASYQRAVDLAGLEVVGFHGLLDSRSDLGLFGHEDLRSRTIDHLVRFSAICRDMGGRTLIVGEGRHNAPADKAAWIGGRSLLEAVARRIEDHGTVLCIAPVPPHSGQFCATANDCYRMVNAIDHPSIGLHVSVAGLAASGETGHATFCVLRGRLEHVHIDGPQGTEPGPSPDLDHADLRRHLAAIDYQGWLSVVHGPAENPMAGFYRSVRFTQDTYLPADRRTSSWDACGKWSPSVTRLGATGRTDRVPSAKGV